MGPWPWWGLIASPESSIRMASRKRKLLDSLCGDLSDEEDEEGDEEVDVKKSKAKEISFEDLEEKGYKAKSVLLMKAPVEEAQVNGWGAWGDGKEAKTREDHEETLESRKETRDIAHQGAEETALDSLREKKLQERLQEERRMERREENANGKSLRVKDKEKRKRDEGKQSRDKSTVEEEKRIARNFGVYSGFD